MRVENIRVWQWMLIGVAVGFLYALLRSSGSGELDSSIETLSPASFEADVLGGGHGRMRIRENRTVVGVQNIVVHPPNSMPDPLDNKKRIQESSFTYEVSLTHAKNTTTKTLRVLTNYPSAKFKGITQSYFGDTSKLTSEQYLNKVKELAEQIKAVKKDPKAHAELRNDPKSALARFLKSHGDLKNVNPYPIDYSVAYGEAKNFAFTVYPIAGFLIIGVAWPTLMHFLIRAGLGRPPEERMIDLSKYKSKPEPEKKKAVVTQEDMDQLAQIEAQLEASLRAAGVEETPARPAAKVPEPVIKKLTSAVSEPIKPEDAAKQANKDFGVDQEDFYPTEVHGKKKD